MVNWALLVILLFLPLPASASWSGFKLQKPGEELVLVGSTTLVQPAEHYRKVIVFGGDVDFRGSTEEFILFGGHIRFASGAEVKKSLVVLGGSFDRENGAKVAGDHIEFKAPSVFYRLLMSLYSVAGDFFQGAIRWLGILFFTILLWGFGLLSRALFARFFADSAAKVFQTFRNTLWAIIGIFAFLPGILFLLLTIIGAVLIPLYVALFLLSFAFAYVILASRLGNIIVFGKIKKDGAWSLLVGLILLQTIWLGISDSFGLIAVLELFAWGAFLRTLKQRF